MNRIIPLIKFPFHSIIWEFFLFHHGSLFLNLSNLHWWVLAFISFIICNLEDIWFTSIHYSLNGCLCYYWILILILEIPKIQFKLLLWILYQFHKFLLKCLFYFRFKLFLSINIGKKSKVNLRIWDWVMLFYT